MKSHRVGIGVGIVVVVCNVKNIVDIIYGARMVSFVLDRLLNECREIYIDMNRVVASVYEKTGSEVKIRVHFSEAVMEIVIRDDGSVDVEVKHI